MSLCLCTSLYYSCSCCFFQAHYFSLSDISSFFFPIYLLVLLPTFTVFTLIWLVTFNICSFARFLWTEKFNILHQTTVYASSIHSNLNPLLLRVCYSNIFSSPINYFIIDEPYLYTINKISPDFFLWISVLHTCVLKSK